MTAPLSKRRLVHELAGVLGGTFAFFGILIAIVAGLTVAAKCDCGLQFIYTAIAILGASNLCFFINVLLAPLPQNMIDPDLVKDFPESGEFRTWRGSGLLRRPFNEGETMKLKPPQRTQGR